jgi:hypothetical protein
LFIVTLCTQIASVSALFPIGYSSPMQNLFGAEFPSDSEGDGPSSRSVTRSGRLLRSSPQLSAIVLRLNEEKIERRKDKTKTKTALPQVRVLILPLSQILSLSLRDPMIKILLL